MNQYNHEYNKKTWFSHSGLDILYRCPRCFWLKYNKDLTQPEGITSRLPARFDRIIKNYFNKFRGTEQLPPITQEKMEGKLENPFQEKYFYSINEEYGFWGKLDECLITANQKYVPVDFKTASSDPREKPAFPAYQNQMDEYAFLLEVNGKKTAGISHLIYFYPDQGEELQQGFPMMILIETLKTNPQSVEPRLIQATEVLRGSIPNPAPDCPFCNWHQNLINLGL